MTARVQSTTHQGIHPRGLPLGRRSGLRYRDRRMRRLALVSLSLCPVACNDDVVDPNDAYFEPDCDGRGPVELLALEETKKSWRSTASTTTASTW